MGTAEFREPDNKVNQNNSKLRAKNHLIRLSNQSISTNNFKFPDYLFTIFWTQPTSLDDINNFITTREIKDLRDGNIQLFVSLIRAVIDHLLQLTSLKDVKLESQFPVLELFNCVRLLTKLLPFLYERVELNGFINELFWSVSVDEKEKLDETRRSTINSEKKDITSTDADGSSSRSNSTCVTSVTSKPLGFRLIEALLDLLFTSGLTVSSTTPTTNLLANTVEFSIWEPGIGRMGKYQQPNPELDSNRLEILRLIIVLSSQCLYKSVSTIVPTGSRFLTVLVSATPKLKILTLIASLLNLSCRSNMNMSGGDQATGLQLSNPQFKEVRIQLVTNAIQLFTLLIVYPIPKEDHKFVFEIVGRSASSSKPVNLVRYYCGKLHKDDELKLMEKGLLMPLYKPFEATASNSGFSGLSNLMKGKLQLSNEPSFWNQELVMLVWELFQCNKRFRTFLAETTSVKLVMALVYNVYIYRNQPKHRNFVRCCSYFVLYLICDPHISSKLLEKIDSDFYESFPQNFKINSPPTTYRDFIIIHTCGCLSQDCPRVLIPTFVEWIYNLVPMVASSEDNDSKTNEVIPMTNRRLSAKNLMAGTTSTRQLSFAAHYVTPFVDHLMIQQLQYT
ncbi:unnamed protein product [Ambrosiozyma monospora]|uniref:Unnamed protein product n=1 Tax=Ambrosiozyma monospora TaxID=43982 RepID=A0A9W7DID6_AMBMO|nr:unnamed protein product [Ambrosiozyma monospora]